MNAVFIDRDALREVTPTALAAYARNAGWTKGDTYRYYSDFYTGLSLPEIIIPRTHQLCDYLMVVARLIETFARVAGVSENAIYYELLAIDRDAVSAGVSDDRDNAEWPASCQS